MDDILIPEHGGEQRLFQQFLAQYDQPAFARRAQRVEEALDQLLSRCARQRDEWLGTPREQFGQFVGCLTAWSDIPEAPASVFARLPALLDVPVAFGSAALGRARRVLRALRGALQTFNARWQAYVDDQDLKPINDLRDGYNRYYVLEKECALRSARLARMGFQHLAPLTAASLLERFPLLPLPETA
jgi:hypothetical protein